MEFPFFFTFSHFFPAAEIGIGKVSGMPSGDSNQRALFQPVNSEGLARPQRNSESIFSKSQEREEENVNCTKEMRTYENKTGNSAKKSWNLFPSLRKSLRSSLPLSVSESTNTFMPSKV